MTCSYGNINMANVKYGNGIVRMIGSLAGNVFSRSKGGNHISALNRRVRTRTSSQKEVRDSFVKCANSWRNEVSENQRLSWIQYGQRKPLPNRLGENIIRTGWNWFLRFNLLRIRNGLSPILNPPDD